MVLWYFKFTMTLSIDKNKIIFTGFHIPLRQYKNKSTRDSRDTIIIQYRSSVIR